MPIYKDQLNNTIQFKDRPRRIISIVPSQSEFLWDIGLTEELIGITKFCIHPDRMYRSVARVGGTKDLDLEKIRQLKPDLIIGNKEENDQMQIETLQKEFNVWMSDIYSFEDAFDMMQNLGEVMNKKTETKEILDQLKRSLPRIKNIFNKQKVAYFIWNKPYMCAAKNTFINHVLDYVGFENILVSIERYPEIEESSLKRLNPDLCFLSSEPFPFKEEHVIELQKIVPRSKVRIVDGEMFSWYGSRLLLLEEYLKRLPLAHSEH